MLGTVDDHLTAELAAQARALEVYLDERFLLTQYDASTFVPRAVELLGDQRGAVLDAGCGVGLVGRLHPHLDLWGVDACFELIAHARVGYQARIECDVETLPFEDSSFDAVLALNMLHHVARPHAAVAEFVRVLRPGGVLVTADPRKVLPVELIKRYMRRGDDTFTQDHKAFTASEYVELLRGGAALCIEQHQLVGLFALLAGGGMDAARISQRFPHPSSLLLRTMDRVDRLLWRVPRLERLGLYMFCRARRR
jgi:SAM-dependent methyltransferase